MPPRPPILRVSLFWFCAFAGLGAYFPFISLYLRDNAGLTASQVGTVLAAAPFVGLFAQPLWGQLADRTGARLALLVVLTLGSAVGYASLSFQRTFGGFLAGVALLAFFSVALTPATWAVALALLRESDSVTKVGWARAAGTVGFGVTVGSFPHLLDRHAGDVPEVGTGAEPVAGLRLLFFIAAGGLTLAALVACTLPRWKATRIRAAPGDLGRLLTSPPFLRLLTAVFLGFLFLQGPSALFPLLIQHHGGGVHAISRMWMWMIALEIPLLGLFGAIVRRIGVKGVMISGILLGAVRWIVSGWSDDLSIVTVAQILHGASVWGLMMAGPAYADSIVPPGIRSTAQGVLTMIGVGVGSSLSMLLAGRLVDSLGATAPARWGGVGSLLLSVSLIWLLPRVSGEQAVAPAVARGS